MKPMKTIKINEDLHTKVKVEAALMKMDIQSFIEAHLTAIVRQAQAIRNNNDKDNNS